MRLLLEAEPEEFDEKRPALLKALHDQFADLDPELANILEKALPHKEPALKFKALRELQKKTKVMYQATLEKMLDEIGQVLDQGVHKSQPDVTLDELRKAARKEKAAKENARYVKVPGSLYSCNECEHWIPGTPAGKNPNACVLHQPGEVIEPNGRCMFWKKGEPIPGREPTGETSTPKSQYRVNDYHTGFRCNRCKFWIEGGACELVEGDIELTATCMLWEVVYNEQVPITKSEPIQKFIGSDNLSKQQRRVQAVDDTDIDYDEESGDPIFDPKTGMSPSETAKDKEDHPEDYETDEAEKSVLADHVEDVIEKEDVAYRRVKTVLKRRGYTDADFLEGGPLYGRGTNELLDMIRQRRAGS